jgi:hypothetical protein
MLVEVRAQRDSAEKPSRKGLNMNQGAKNENQGLVISYIICI